MAFIGTRLRDMLRLIAHGDDPKVLGGFRVSFDREQGRMLAGDYFPARDEEPFATEAEAWTWAKILALNAPKEIVNIYVIYAKDFGPVEGYREKALRYHESEVQMHSPETCGKVHPTRGNEVFCQVLKDPQGSPAPCAVKLGRGDDCPLEHTMQSGDSSVIQQGDAGER